MQAVESERRNQGVVGPFFSRFCFEKIECRRVIFRRSSIISLVESIQDNRRRPRDTGTSACRGSVEEKSTREPGTGEDDESDPEIVERSLDGADATGDFCMSCSRKAKIERWEMTTWND